MPTILGVSWCLPCLTIAKGTGGFPPTAKKFSSSTVNPSDRDTKNKLCAIQANSSLFPNIIPPCTTLIDTTFNASNAFLKLALLQKRNSSGKCGVVNDICSKGSRFSVSLPIHMNESRSRPIDALNEIKTHSTELRGTILSPSKINKRSQSDLNLDSIDSKSASTDYQIDIQNSKEDQFNIISIKHNLKSPKSYIGQKSTAVVRPCLRHRRSSYDDILRRSSEKGLNTYSSLDSKLSSNKATTKIDPILSSFENNTSTQPLNKSVKFILPESSKQKRMPDYGRTTTAPWHSAIADKSISPANFPLTSLAPLPYEYMIQHQGNCYGTLNSSNSFPNSQYIPSLKEPPCALNANHSLIFSSNATDPSSFSKANFALPGALCNTDSLQPPMQLLNQALGKDIVFPTFEKYQENKCTKQVENSIPTTIYWSTGCIYDPTVYYTTMTNPSAFCTTCCWNCHKDGLPMISYPPETKLAACITSASNTIDSTRDKSVKQCTLSPSSTIKHPFNENEVDDNTDSDEESTEGDCNVDMWFL